MTMRQAPSLAATTTLSVTGYVSSLTAAGAMTPLMELAQLGSLPGFAPFYYHNRMFETGATRAADTPRLKESGFGPLEAM